MATMKAERFDSSLPPLTVATADTAYVRFHGRNTGAWERGVDTGELVLDAVRVPANNVVGEVGGFRLAMLGLNSMRPIVAARGIGLAEGALMYAVEYVKQRGLDEPAPRR